MENIDEKDTSKEEVMDHIEEQETAAENNADMTDVQESDELTRIQDELADSKDKYLRLYSEFDNFRRRTAKEKLDMTQTANEELMAALIPILDDFERAEKSFDGEASVESLKEGFDLIYNKFRKILEQKGLTAMDTGEGSEFDPDYHEAITQIPAPKKKLVGKVVDVIEKGYMLKEKVVRYAKVVTGS